MEQRCVKIDARLAKEWLMRRGILKSKPHSKKHVTITAVSQENGDSNIISNGKANELGGVDADIKPQIKTSQDKSPSSCSDTGSSSSSSSCLWSCTSSSPPGSSGSSSTDVSPEWMEKRKRRSGYVHQHKERSSSPPLIQPATSSQKVYPLGQEDFQICVPVSQEDDRIFKFAQIMADEDRNAKAEPCTSKYRGPEKNQKEIVQLSDDGNERSLTPGTENIDEKTEDKKPEYVTEEKVFVKEQNQVIPIAFNFFAPQETTVCQDKHLFMSDNPTQGYYTPKPSIVSSHISQANSVGSPTGPAMVGSPSVPAMVGGPTVPAMVGSPTVPAMVGSPAVPAMVGSPTVPAKLGSPTVPAMVGSPTVPAKLGSPAVPAMVGRSTVPAMVGSPTVPAMVGGPTVPAMVGRSTVPAMVGSPTVPAMGGGPTVPAMVGSPAVPAMVGSPAVPAMVGSPAVPAMVLRPTVPAMVLRPTVPAMVGRPTVSAMVGSPTVPAMVGSPTVPAMVGRSTVPAMVGSPTFPAKLGSPTVPAMVGSPTVPAMVGSPNVPGMVGRPTVPAKVGSPTVPAKLGNYSIPFPAADSRTPPDTDLLSNISNTTTEINRDQNGFLPETGVLSRGISTPSTQLASVFEGGGEQQVPRKKTNVVRKHKKSCANDFHFRPEANILFSSFVEDNPIDKSKEDLMTSSKEFEDFLAKVITSSPQDERTIVPNLHAKPQEQLAKDTFETPTGKLCGSDSSDSSSSGWSPEYESGLSCPDDIDVVVIDLNGSQEMEADYFNLSYDESPTHNGFASNFTEEALADEAAAVDSNNEKTPKKTYTPSVTNQGSVKMLDNTKLQPTIISDGSGNLVFETNPFEPSIKTSTKLFDAKIKTETKHTESAEKGRMEKAEEKISSSKDPVVKGVAVAPKINDCLGKSPKPMEMVSGTTNSHIQKTKVVGEQKFISETSLTIAKKENQPINRKLTIRNREPTQASVNMSTNDEIRRIASDAYSELMIAQVKLMEGLKTNKFAQKVPDVSIQATAVDNVLGKPCTTSQQDGKDTPKQNDLFEQKTAEKFKNGLVKENSKEHSIKKNKSVHMSQATKLQPTADNIFVDGRQTKIVNEQKSVSKPKDPIGSQPLLVTKSIKNTPKEGFSNLKTTSKAQPCLGTVVKEPMFSNVSNTSQVKILQRQKSLPLKPKAHPLKTSQRDEKLPTIRILQREIRILQRESKGRQEINRKDTSKDKDMPLMQRKEQEGKIELEQKSNLERVSLNNRTVELPNRKIKVIKNVNHEVKNLTNEVRGKCSPTQLTEQQLIQSTTGVLGGKTATVSERFKQQPLPNMTRMGQKTRDTRVEQTAGNAKKETLTITNEQWRANRETLGTLGPLMKTEKIVRIESETRTSGNLESTKTEKLPLHQESHEVQSGLLKIQTNDLSKSLEHSKEVNFSPNIGKKTPQRSNSKEISVQQSADSPAGENTDVGNPEQNSTNTSEAKPQSFLTRIFSKMFSFPARSHKSPLNDDLLSDEIPLQKAVETNESPPSVMDTSGAGTSNTKQKHTGCTALKPVHCRDSVHPTKNLVTNQKEEQKCSAIAQQAAPTHSIGLQRPGHVHQLVDGKTNERPLEVVNKTLAATTKKATVECRKQREDKEHIMCSAREGAQSQMRYPVKSLLKQFSKECEEGGDEKPCEADQVKPEKAFTPKIDDFPEQKNS